MSAGYSGKVWACPFFRWDQRGRFHCEGGCVAFEDRETYGEYTEKYCCSVEGWEDCTLAQALTRQYDRQEEDSHEKEK